MKHIVLTALLLTAGGPFLAPGASARVPAPRYMQARASWYSLPGRKTASGERFHPQRATFASRHLPFGTVVEFRVGARRVRARCNDRGPYVRGRLFDLSKGAARKLGMTKPGVVTVRYRIVRRGK